MTALLEVIKNQPIESIGEKLIYGGQMLLIGMATVFAVLVLLWGCLVVFKIVFHDIGKTRTKAPAASKSVDVVETTPVATDNSAEIVAVIAAAIAAAESESSGLKFKVVSFRRK